MQEMTRQYKTRKGVEQFIQRHGFVSSAKETGAETYDVVRGHKAYRAGIIALPGPWGKTEYLMSVICSE
jgi:hypothetical protein